MCVTYIRVESYTCMHPKRCINISIARQGCFCTEARVRSAARSWNTCKYMYRDEAEEDRFFSRHSSWNHRSRLHEAPLFATPWASSCPATAQYRLTPQQSIPMTASLAIVREPQCRRFWQFLGTRTRSSHVGCLEVAGSSVCHTVWSRSGPQHE